MLGGITVEFDPQDTWRDVVPDDASGLIGVSSPLLIGRGGPGAVLPEQVSRLHRIASTWFSDHGMLSEAIDQALSAGDTGRAVRLDERDGRTLLKHSQRVTVLGMIDQLPPSAVITSPRLQLTAAWSEPRGHSTRPPIPQTRSMRPVCGPTSRTKFSPWRSVPADSCVRTTPARAGGRPSAAGPRSSHKPRKKQRSGCCSGRPTRWLYALCLEPPGRDNEAQQQSARC
ncbi:hypothetical protein EF294_06915 [Gordonia oryzae]|uniref:Uncharacterized protein n=1 Tax=Gordonia oryzae TaxID=2487349 RepID=A0A3N4GTQ1_9ACTN|nr:hypothetical protein EF294_06915 [Gordonia oryzae]